MWAPNEFERGSNGFKPSYPVLGQVEASYADKGLEAIAQAICSSWWEIFHASIIQPSLVRTENRGKDQLAYVSRPKNTIRKSNNPLYMEPIPYAHLQLIYM